MELHTRFQYRGGLIATMLVCLVSLSGCAGLPGSRPILGVDNAFQIGFERPPHETIDEFRGYLESVNIKVLSVDGDTLRSDPGNLYGSAVQGYGQTIRLIGVAETTKKGSELIVRADYLDPASGEWKEASSKTNVLLGYEAQNTRPHYRAYKDVAGLLIQRYGSKKVKFVRSDLQY